MKQDWYMRLGALVRTGPSYLGLQSSSATSE